MLPRHLQIIVNQIEKSINKAASAQNEGAKRANEQQIAAVAKIKRLADNFEGYEKKQTTAEAEKRGRENKTIVAIAAEHQKAPIACPNASSRL
jgi:hypothetical protein